MEYARAVELDLSCEDAVIRVKAAFAEQGFGTLTEIDVTSTLRAKLGHETEPYVILGMCNPALAFRGLEADRRIGLLLPCNVVVRRVANRTRVEALDASVIAAISEAAELKEIAEEGNRGIAMALQSLCDGPEVPSGGVHGLEPASKRGQRVSATTK